MSRICNSCVNMKARANEKNITETKGLSLRPTAKGKTVGPNRNQLISKTSSFWLVLKIFEEATNHQPKKVDSGWICLKGCKHKTNQRSVFGPPKTSQLYKPPTSVQFPHQFRAFIRVCKALILASLKLDLRKSIGRPVTHNAWFGPSAKEVT